MKAWLWSIAIATLFGVILILGLVKPVPSAQLDSTTFTAGAYVRGEILVKFKPAYGAQQRNLVVLGQGDAVLANLKQPGWVHVKIAAGQTVTQALAAYRSHPDVETAQPNYIYRATAIPNDPQYGQLWAFKNIGQTIASGTYLPNSGTPGADINIEKAWDQITDCGNTVVAVVDSGINYDQEDLTDNMWNGGLTFPKHGFDFVDNDNDPMDLNGHGTHVAGIIGATGNNAIGVTGVCWKASIMAVRVLDAQGVGTTATLEQGINFAVNNGAKVINMSIGGAGGFDPLFSAAITNAQAKDVVVIVAAGNETNDNDVIGNARYPCNFTQPNLICVAALDQNYALASFSNWGATSVDVGAPGTNILSAWAGAHATITDSFNSGGILDWLTSGGGWAYSALTLAGSPIDALVNPATFPTGAYSNNADNRVYKTFNLSGANAATLRFFAQFSIQPGDFLSVGYRNGVDDPFAGGVQLDSISGFTGGLVGPLSYDLSPCISVACAVGFQLLTDASVTDQGVRILFFGIETLQLNNNSYNTVAGTSMVTAEVAGLAAMLRAYNPKFTYADVVNAIKNAGRPVLALSGKTTTGKAIDVMSSLAYINPPGGLRATVH